MRAAQFIRVVLAMARNSGLDLLVGRLGKSELVKRFGFRVLFAVMCNGPMSEGGKWAS